ncbi:MAG: protein translocase subunit SecD [bacterium]
MMNRYPLWKYLLIVFVVAVAVIYAMPNLYAPDPAVQISGQNSSLTITDENLTQAKEALVAAGIEVVGGEVTEKAAIVRLAHSNDQLVAKATVQDALGHGYVVALNQAPTTPDWLVGFGASPMKLGLDLSGGVHFLMEVDTAEAVQKRMASNEKEIRKLLREDRIRYRSVRLVDESDIKLTFDTEEEREKASQKIKSEMSDLIRTDTVEDDKFVLTVAMSEAAIKQIVEYALDQNLTTLRNRVNELGVSEPIVQRQGANRIVVELPGVQDSAEAKRIIGKTATLEFRLEADPGALTGKETFQFRDNERQTAQLETRVVVQGDNVTGAQSAFDENGMPQVNIRLDSEGGTRMHRLTRDNVGRRLGVLFIENKTRLESRTDENGEVVEEPVKYVDKKIISLATVQSALGVSFRITGLNSPAEASELALLLRAGALAAPMDIVEERTIGPSLGAENIAKGIDSVTLGMALVLVFMLLFYKVFGFFANIALALNVIILIAAMSILGATLTLPGIAGIVLTIGMAVDANVLIFSRIREELKNGLSVQNAIRAGYERAFVSILDANLTTLIVAVILYAIGSGPVQGFAVTLSVGILTSMFTAIVVTRAIVNLIYGGRKVEKLWI